MAGSGCGHRFCTFLAEFDPRFWIFDNFGFRASGGKSVRRKKKLVIGGPVQNCRISKNGGQILLKKYKTGGRSPAEPDPANFSQILAAGPSHHPRAVSGIANNHPPGLQTTQARTLSFPTAPNQRGGNRKPTFMHLVSRVHLPVSRPTSGAEPLLAQRCCMCIHQPCTARLSERSCCATSASWLSRRVWSRDSPSPLGLGTCSHPTQFSPWWRSLSRRALCKTPCACARRCMGGSPTRATLRGPVSVHTGTPPRSTARGTPCSGPRPCASRGV